MNLHSAAAITPSPLLAVATLFFAVPSAQAHSPFLYAWAAEPLSCRFSNAEARAEATFALAPQEEITVGSLFVDANIETMRLANGEIVSNKKVRLLCLPHPDNFQCGTPEGLVFLFSQRSVTSHPEGFTIGEAGLSYKRGKGYERFFGGSGTCKLKSK